LETTPPSPTGDAGFDPLHLLLLPLLPSAQIAAINEIASSVSSPKSLLAVAVTKLVAFF
jgi:hypothetical protein